MRHRRTTEPALVVTGANPVLELLRSGAPVERLVIGPGPRRADLVSESRRRGVAHVEGDRATLDRLAGRGGHQGTVAYAPPFRYRALEDVDAAGARCILVLDGIQDPRNLGAILRTARAAGVSGVVLPQDRSCGITSVVRDVLGEPHVLHDPRQARDDLRRLDPPQRVDRSSGIRIRHGDGLNTISPNSSISK